MKASEILTMPLGRVMSLTLCSVGLTACCALSAQTTDGKGGPPKPPAEALASCKALSSGTECSFASPQGTVTGTCWAPEGKPLACKPKGPPPGSPMLPKQ